MTQAADVRYTLQNPGRQARLEGMKLASFRARLGAFAADGFLAGVLALCVSLPFRLADVARPAGEDVSFSVGFDGLPGFILFVGYFALMTWKGQGRTPGKRLFGIRVVSLYHDHLTLWHCIERALGYSASALEAGFGFLQFFTHPNRQTVHDRIAETLVVEAHEAGL